MEWCRRAPPGSVSRGSGAQGLFWGLLGSRVPGSFPGAHALIGFWVRAGYTGQPRAALKAPGVA